MKKREFEGIGVHSCDPETDFISVDSWMKRPDDIRGQALGISRLLPPGVRVDPALCAEWGKEYYLGDLQDCPYPCKGGNEICQPPKIKFRITIEVEEIAGA